MTSKRDAAVALAKQGFRIFPLVSNGKTPAIERADWQVIASKDPTRVAEMWTDPVFESEIDYNIGIALDKDTLVVDVDTRDGKQGDKSLALLEAIYEPVHETLEVETASGATHLYFRTDAPVGNSASKVGKHIDIKTEGGFVVGPGSTIDGRPYTVARDNEIAGANGWLVQLAGAPRDREKVAAGAAPLVDENSPAAIARAVEYLTTKAPDNGTYAIAAKVKDFGVSQDTALALMLEHWRDARHLDKDDEHIAFRVANAYRYGQNAIGSASPEAEFEPVEIDQKPAPKRGLYPLRWADAKPILDRPYLIDDVMDLGAMVVTYGDSNVGKTYVKLDQAFHIAAGRDWNGHKVRQGLVVYVAAEGGTGFLKRIEAFRRHYGVADLPFTLVPCPIDLFSEQGDTSKLVKLIRAEEEHFGQKCVLVVIDTLARAMAGGDENLAADMGKFVAHCDRLRAATAATVDVIHHTGKDASKGARGSSALRAATDTELEISEGLFVASKQRDMEKGKDRKFRLVPVEIGQRSDGKVVLACVVEWPLESEFDDSISPAAQDMLDILERLWAARVDEIEETADGDADGAGGAADAWVTWSDWQDECLSALRGARRETVKRTRLFALRKELSDTGRIEKNSRKDWRPKATKSTA